MALDAAYEIDNSSFEFVKTHALGRCLSTINERLAVPYGDVEASVQLGNLFNMQGGSVKTIEQLRQSIKVMAEMLMGTHDDLQSNRDEILAFCMALTKTSKTLKYSRVM